MATKEQEQALARARARRLREQAGQRQQEDAHPREGLGALVGDLWEGYKGVARSGIGAAENVLSTANAMVAVPIAETAAYLKGGFSEDTPENRARVEEIANSASDYIYSPKTEQGKRIEESFQTLIQDMGVDTAFEYVINPPWSKNEDGTKQNDHLVKAMLGLIPVLGGIKRRSPRRPQPGQGTTTPDTVRDAGIDINKPGSTIVENLSRLADEQRIGERGASMPRIREGLEYLAEQARTRTAALYAQADSLGGRIPATRKQTQSLRDNTENVINEYNIYDSTGKTIPGMHAVDLRLADFRKMFTDNPNPRLRISDIESYRQRLLRDARRSSDDTEKSALGYMRQQLDNWEMGEFTKIVSSQSRETFEAYLKARDSSRAYINTFTAEKVIDQLLNEQNVTNSQMRGFLLGAQKNGLPHAAAVVERLNKMFGEDSPQMNALRQDFLYEIAEPLVNLDTYASPVSGVRAFIRNYENSIAKNPELIRHLAPYSKSSLEQTYLVAKSLDSLDLTDTQLMNRFDPIKLTARLLAGNQLAKGTARLGVVESVMKVLINTAKPNRRRLYEELFGYDPNAPVLSKTRTTAAGAIIADQTYRDREDDEAE